MSQIPELVEAEGGLRLRPWGLDDAPLLLAAVQDRFLAQLLKLRYRGGRALANWIRRQESSPVIMPRAAHQRGRGRLDPGQLYGWVLPDFRCQGLGARAARLLCAWAAQHLQVVTALISERNVSARAGLERLGFKRGARVPEYAGYRRPPYDTVCYYRSLAIEVGAVVRPAVGQVLSERNPPDEVVGQA